MYNTFSHIKLKVIHSKQHIKRDLTSAYSYVEFRSYAELPDPVSGALNEQFQTMCFEFEAR